MRTLSDNQREQVREMWAVVSLDIRERYNLSPLQVPREVLLSSTDTPLEPFQPGSIEGKTLILNRNLPDFEPLIPHTTAKLCLQSALPSDLLCQECIDDLSFEYARESIDDDRLREKWEEIWEKHSPKQQVSQVLVYHPCLTYKWLHSLAGSEALDTMIRELAHRAKNQISVSFDDYMRYFTTRSHRFEHALDDTELKIISALIANPETPANEIAQKIGISEEWLSKKIAQLEKLYILMEFERPPFSRIGIGLFHGLISQTTGDVDLYNLFKNCPFLYSFRQVVSGRHHALATLSIPNNPESEDLLKQGLKILEKKGVTTETHHVVSSGIAHCFDYYSPKTGAWDIPWELLTIHLERIYHDNLAATMPRVYTPEKRTTMKLDELDMRIFDCLKMRISSVAKMRSKLRVGQQRLVNHLNALRENGLIAKQWEAHNIGLTENAFVYTKNREAGQAIAAWALRLPRAVISFSSEKELMLEAYLPRGGSYGLASALETINGDTSVGILSSKIYGGWGFPSHLWNPKLQNWTCPKKELKDWIESISSEV